MTATTAASARSVGLGARFVHAERSAMQITAVQIRHGGFAFLPVCHFDKRKPAGLTGHAIGNEIDSLDRTVLRKDRRKIFLRRVETQVSNVNVNHLKAPVANCSKRSQNEEDDFDENRAAGRTFSG